MKKSKLKRDQNFENWKKAFERDHPADFSMFNDDILFEIYTT